MQGGTVFLRNTFYAILFDKLLDRRMERLLIKTALETSANYPTLAKADFSNMKIAEITERGFRWRNLGAYSIVT